MKKQVIVLIAFIGLISCDQKPHNKQSNTKGTSKQKLIEKELWTLYSKSDTVYHVKKLLFYDGSYSLLSYDINTAQPEASYQTFIRKQAISEKDTSVVGKQQCTVFGK